MVRRKSPPRPPDAWTGIVTTLPTGAFEYAITTDPPPEVMRTGAKADVIRSFVETSDRDPVTVVLNGKHHGPYRNPGLSEALETLLS